MWGWRGARRGKNGAYLIEDRTKTRLGTTCSVISLPVLTIACPKSDSIATGAALEMTPEFTTNHARVSPPVGTPPPRPPARPASRRTDPAPKNRPAEACAGRSQPPRSARAPRPACAP